MPGSLSVRKKNAANAPTAVERQVEKIFGLKPKQLRNRGIAPAVLNRKTNKIEWSWPQPIYDLARAFVTPGLAAAGQPIGDPEEAATNFALNFTGTGGVAGRAGRGALGEGRAVLGMSGAPKIVKDIRPSTDDVYKVMEANTTAGKVIGDKMMPINKLNGGVTAAADDARRVDKLVKEMSSPEGYVSRLIVDDVGNVIEGQHRLEALRKMGVSEVPVTQYADLERAVPYREMRDAAAAQGVHPDQANQIAKQLAEIYADEGGDMAEVMQYSAPKGFEKAWDAAISALPAVEKEAAPLAVKPTVAATPRSAVGALSAAEPTGIIAYHGSPHSFDRFDISKIGTGEGAQAYGHGLYFAEAEPVAQEYRQRLAKVTAAPFDRIGIPPNEWNAATMFARQMDPTLPDIAARDFAAWTGRDVTPELIDAFKTAKTPGSMYQVRINADPNRLLNWDQPITAQSPELQQAVLSAARDADISHLGSGHRSRVKLERFMDAAEQPHDPIKGSELMMAIDRSPGNNFAPETSKLLRNYGIPGIKYLDQGSRIAGDGSRNYVVFDDALIDLLRKYAIGGAVNSSPSQ